MAKKKESAITKVEPNPGLVAPGYMKDAPRGTVELGQYVIPPRIKIVQKQASEELLEQYGVGDIIVIHGDGSTELIAEMGHDKKGRPTGDSDGFLFTPLYFFVEYVTWNPIEMKGRVPAIADRTLDKQHPIAVKSRSAETRHEPHPADPKYHIRHVEHLNFMCLIENVEEPVILSFARGSHKDGRALANLIKMRHAAIYGCIFQCKPAFRENEQGSWWVPEVFNPPAEISDPWVDEDQFEINKQLHLEMQKSINAAKVVVQYDDGEISGSDGEISDEF